MDCLPQTVQAALQAQQPVRIICERFRCGGGKRHRTLPIYGDMKSALESQKQEREEKYPALEWVFHDGCGQRLRTFYKAWNSACRRAKLSGQLFHDLRRSAVRNMVRAGIPEKVAMAISGHRTRHVFDRYNIVTDKDLGRSGGEDERIPRFSSQQLQVVATSA